MLGLKSIYVSNTTVLCGVDVSKVPLGFISQTLYELTHQISHGWCASSQTGMQSDPVNALKGRFS